MPICEFLGHHSYGYSALFKSWANAIKGGGSKDEGKESKLEGRNKMEWRVGFLIITNEDVGKINIIN